jgi:hypothetical protein
MAPDCRYVKVRTATATSIFCAIMKPELKLTMYQGSQSAAVPANIGSIRQAI